ncbi:MAG: SRPBCC family protein [Chthoniobacteraceae bacterium]
MSLPAHEALLGREFTIIREFDAPRELVWKACTDAAHLAQWWGPKGFSNPICEWDPVPGGRIYVVMRGPNGEDYPMGGEFREIVAPEKLVTVTGAMGADGALLFEILHTMTLTEEQGKTKLTMFSRVISTTPGAERYIGGFEMGMTMTLERLGEHLGQKTEPFIIERTFDAPVEKVWSAISDREQMKHWYFELEAFRAEEGTEFEFTVEHEGMTFRHRCTVMEVIPQKRLAYTWRYEGHPGDSLVSFDLIAEGAKTRLKLTHVGLESFPATPQFARANFMRGWTHLVGTDLKEFVETK